MENKAKIKEIFASVQGEGLYIGTKQLFIRFCACNLHCNYCDTSFMPDNINNKESFFEFTPNELEKYINDKFGLDTIRFISLTGGEPLIWNEFLAEFMPKIKTNFYLETNATITDNLEKILPYTHTIAADIKLPSCSGIKNSFELHNAFFNKVKHYKIDCAVHNHYDCDAKKVFAKIIFDNAITDEEIDNCLYLGKTYGLELILQPKMNNYELSVTSEFMIDTFNKFTEKYRNVRLIPQVHKFLDIE